jgi:hypothetical protein
MAINFPSNPANNDTYSYNGQNWYWANNYSVWLANTLAIGYTGSTGYLGSFGYTGSLGYTGSTGAGYTGSIGDKGYTGSAGLGGGGGSVSLTANNTDTIPYYFPMANSTELDTATWSYGTVSNTYLYFIPSTGTLNSQIFNSLSDVNKKSNIETIGSAIDTINKLRGVSFDWKDNGRHSYGLIAQEVEQVIPAIVSTAPDGTKTLNYDAIIGFLIEAIKELANNKR